MSIPPFPTFDVEADKSNAAHRWNKWVGRLENLLTGLNISNDARKKALLLHYAGERVYDIYEAEKAGSDDNYAEAKQTITDYFSPKLNTKMEIYKFRICKQKQSQTLDEYVTELRTLSKSCEFADNDAEILQQLIQNCKSNRLRRKALQETDKKLPDILTLGRAIEVADEQATEMENQSENVNAVKHRSDTRRRGNGRRGGASAYHSRGAYQGNPKSVHRQRTTQCRNCGGQFPHRGTCPAKGKNCNFCKKTNHFMKMCLQKKGSVKTLNAKSEQSESSEEEYCYKIAEKASRTPNTKVLINGLSCNMLIDTGSTVNILDETTYNNLGCPKLSKKSLPKLLPYGDGRPLALHGKCELTIEKNKNITVDTFYVVKNQKSGALIGYSTAHNLKLIEVVHKVQEADLCEKFPKIFEGIGKLKDQTVKIHINKDVRPVAQRNRRTPFHLREKVEKEIENLIQQDIVEKVENEPTPWISPIVTPPKKDKNEIRICVDMREANKAIERERHLMPTIEELINDLNGAKVFSKLDLRSGYHQLELDKSSRQITTFNTHIGIYRYKRLNFGISSASEVFQATISSLIQDVRNAKNISDDIIVFGNTQEEHDTALSEVFEVLHKNGLTLNRKKCEFNKTEISFFGVVFSAGGVSADPLKVEAIKNMEQPQNVSELKSFLGMTSYCSRFIKDYATITEPLRKLTRSETEWQWGSETQSAFRRLQNELSSDTVMCYFDPNKKTEVVTDASPVGISGILAQENKIVAYASRALTDVESRYSQTEREALAVVWACEHYDMYLRGAPQFTVITDHKPLERIWQKRQPPLRIERWGLRLQPFNMIIQYRPGKDNPSDYMSPHPVKAAKRKFESVAEEYVNFVAESAVMKAMTLDEVIQATSHDKTMLKAIEMTRTGRWHELKQIQDEEIDIEDLTQMKHIREELVVHSENILLRNNRIILPSSLYRKAINISHEGHQGITKTKAFLRSKVWFPKMNELTEEAIQSCLPCQANTGDKKYAPLNVSELPSGPWQNLSADFCGPLPSGEYLLVIVDEYSRYPIVEILKSLSANRVIPLFDKVLAEMGVPKIIKTDNGSPFNSDAFRQFAKYCGFSHRRITPRWPRANAQAESFNKPLMKSIKTSHVQGKNWKQEMFHFLRQYRCTPHVSTGFTPFRLLFQREPQTRLPETHQTKVEFGADEKARQNDEKSKARGKTYYDRSKNAAPRKINIGDNVLLANEHPTKISSKYMPETLTVQNKKGNMITASNDSREVTRNSSHFKKLSIDNSQHSEEKQDSADEEETPAQEPKTAAYTNKRPVRNRHEPTYLKDFVK